MNHKISLPLFLTICLFCVKLAFANVSNSSENLVTGLPIEAQSASVVPGQMICLDITVADFDSIVNMQYVMSWDTSVIQYVDIMLVDVPDPAFFGSNALDEGLLFISWNADQNNGWASVPDGTILYQLCFEIVGEVGECTNLDFYWRTLGY